MNEDLEQLDDDGRTIVKTKNVIKAIDTVVTHRICSGQVIVTLSTAIKELVENSLDAGGTSIEIRLVDFGSKLIEVKDNGLGIEESNFANLARKHHTSKLSEFEDLESIGTFGFRGEALSALSALSESLTVLTRNQESKQGFQIEYNQQGEIVSQSIVARQIGTTVRLKNIFSALPVRHKEFLKNLKREFHRMITVLYGYSIVASGVRISCRNEVNGNSNNSVLCVPASEGARERIANIFGNKQLTSLIDIETEEEIGESILTEFDLTRNLYEETEFQLTGLISGPNSGRSSTDRQFYFVNSRPCDSAKISRLVNEVYHTFSRSQYPFIYLNIMTKQEHVDVNVTPDKRTLFLQNEKALYALIKGTILKTLTNASSNLSQSVPSSSLQKTLNFYSIPVSTSSPEEEDVGAMDENESDVPSAVDADDDDVVMMLSTPSLTPNGFDRQFSALPPVKSTRAPKVQESPKTVRSYLTKFKFGNCANEDEKGSTMSSYMKRPSPTSLQCGVWRKPKPKQPKLMDFIFSKTNKTAASSRKLSQEAMEEEEEDDEIQILDNVNPIKVSLSRGRPDCNPSANPENEGSSNPRLSQDSLVPTEENLDQLPEDYCDLEDERGSRESVPVAINWATVLPYASKIRERLVSFHQGPSEERVGRRFRAKISPDENSSAETELKKSLSKEMFKEMRLIGQFNLGFIVTKLGSDLFIIDQHAADEKFNYEDLEKSMVLEGQRLIIPMSLQLPAISENILMDNLSVFEKNGFSFNIKRSAKPTKRVSLTKIPYLKSYQFGKQDVEELIYLLEDAPEKSFYRPMKVRTMLASRACRKSVMIGDTLSEKDMERVVGQLADIEQPWNCPHGRPTLRHLFNLDLLPDPDWFK